MNASRFSTLEMRDKEYRTFVRHDINKYHYYEHEHCKLIEIMFNIEGRT